MNKITLDRFITAYNKQADEHKKEKYLEEQLQIKQYIPTTEKIERVTSLVMASTHEVKSIDKEKKKIVYGKFRDNTPGRYILTVLHMIDLYTNIEIDFDNTLLSYDALNMVGMVEKILNAIPEKEYNEFQYFVKMIYEDVKTNEYEPHAFVSSQVERLSSLLNKFGKPFLNIISGSIDRFANGVLNEVMTEVKDELSKDNMQDNKQDKNEK